MHKVKEEVKIKKLQEKIEMKDLSVKRIQQKKLEVIEEKKIEEYQKRFDKRKLIEQDKEERIKRQLAA